MALEIVKRLRNGDRLACAKAITLIENESPEADHLLEEIFPAWGSATRIGVTGSPGSGKSSLVNHLAARIRKDGKTIGIVAVDPSSPFSGGALLGDRIRMQNVHLDKGVFIRSMATRGTLGGLAKAADDVVLVFDAFGKDYVIIETVGVGQSEVDIAQSAETTILVLTPDAGDAVQALKAGIMEIADIFVVNKSDKPGADRINVQVQQMLELAQRPDGAWIPPIVNTISTTGVGIDELYDRVIEHHEFLEKNGLLESKRENSARRKVKLTAEALVREALFSGENAQLLEEKVRQVCDGKCTPQEAARNIVENYLKGDAASGS